MSRVGHQTRDLPSNARKRNDLTVTFYSGWTTSAVPIFTGTISKYPARSALAAYALLIIVGTSLLMLPICQGDQQDSLTFLDAAFTSTSAVCVTGLIVRSTEHDLSPTGQLVVLTLVQIGGIGIITLTTLVTLQLGRIAGIREQLAVSEALGSRPGENLRWVIRRVLVTVGLFEGVGFLILWGRNLQDMSAGEAAWQALFHSVSAFCNAGFSLHDDSLMQYQGDLMVNLTVCGLIIFGGLGFPVLFDVWKTWRKGPSPFWSHLALHSKLVLIGTALLLSIGTLAFLVLEHRNALTDMHPGRQLMVSFFHATSCRTAGFNTVDIGALTNATLFVSMLLMMIGASPCSTGGGFKVSTMMVLCLTARSKLRGDRQTHFSSRSISEEIIDRSIAAVLLFALIGVIGLTVLLSIEQSQASHLDTKGSFLETFFEVVSALGTVGLSTGITATLSVQSKLMLILMMFVGRLGPISIFVAVSSTQRNAPIEFPAEDVLIG